MWSNVLYQPLFFFKKCTLYSNTEPLILKNISQISRNEKKTQQKERGKEKGEGEVKKKNAVLTNALSI